MGEGKSGEREVDTYVDTKQKKHLTQNELSA